MATTAETLTLALQYYNAGNLQAAEEICRRILAIDPNEANAWNLLGVIGIQLGRRQAGVECFRRALAVDPACVCALHNLGKLLLDQRQLDEAAAYLRRTIELQPNFVEAHLHLGLALHAQGKSEEAVACYRRALQLKPDYVVAFNDLGIALASQGKLDEAVACFGQALQLQPDFAEAHSNLGGVRRTQGELLEAVACYQHALQLKSDYARAHVNLANALSLLGRLDEAAACYRRALELKPDDAGAHSSLLSLGQYRDSVTLKELAEAHAEYEQKHAAPLRAAWTPHDNDRDPRRRLRVGFLSRDLRRHAVAYFLIRVLENLDRERCETVCYHDAAVQDDMTARLRAAAATWSDVHGRSDEQLARQIRADRIDILFDLAGHTDGNRLLVFARKPAPIQVTWIGYAGTTGLAAMDYILADRYEIPPESEGYYRERVLRMPDGYLCYDPPEYAPPVSPLPAIEKGYVTLAAFHNPHKITAEVVEVWARVLRRLPGARLVLKFPEMDNSSVASRLAGLFANRGIDPTRLEFLGLLTHGQTLTQYQRIDLALDCFPYNGCTTTCEALWMGVPMVTHPGETFAGRASLSHLSNVGLTETIAGSLDEYVEIAVNLAGDLPRLAALRAGLRERMAASPLCDGKRFTANFMEVLRGAWRDWCETGE